MLNREEDNESYALEHKDNLEDGFFVGSNLTPHEENPNQKQNKLFRNGNSIMDNEEARLFGVTPTNRQDPDNGEECTVARILLDSNLVLDLLLDRKTSHLEDVANIFDLASIGTIDIYLTDRGIQDVWNVIQFYKGEDSANLITNTIVDKVDVCRISAEIMDSARNSSLSNFDSALQLACLEYYKLDTIVTNHPDAFVGKSPSSNGGNFSILNPASFESWISHDLKRSSLHLSLQEKKESIEKGYSSVTVDVNDLKIAGMSIEQFEIYSTQGEISLAHMSFWSPKTQELQTISARGNGPVAALCSALDEGLSRMDFPHSYRMESINLRSLSSGSNSEMRASVVLTCEGIAYVGNSSHQDTIKSVFYAYINALKSITSNSSTEDKIQSRNTKRSMFDASSNSIESLTNRDFHQSLQKGKQDFSESTIKSVYIADQKILDAHLQKSTLERVIIKNSSLYQSDALLSEALDLDIWHSDIEQLKAQYSSWGKVSLDSVNLKKANLFHATINSSSARDVDFSSSEMNKAEISQTCFIDCNFQSVDLDNATLRMCLFHSGNLSNSRLTELNCESSYFLSVLMYSANLSQSNFSKVRFSHSILRKVDFSESTLEDVDLSGVKLENSKFNGATFNRVNLSNANLSGCDLRGVNLETTYLSGANLTGALFDEGVTPASLSSKTRLWSARLSEEI
ncbi:MAG: pentapeptide repeat-containing protein [Cyanobacteria bacterium P01_D01_bin.105]